MQTNSTIFVAGATGLAGSAIARRLSNSGYRHILAPNRQALDLKNRIVVDRFFKAHAPEYVFLAAARVGGIQANAQFPAEFLQENLSIQCNVIDAAYRHGAKKLLFLGSSCIYPRLAPQPIREESLLTGSLEPTNQWYAIAKIAGLKMCEAYALQYGWNAISLMPTNLYGPGDNFSETQSHVLPALIRRFHEAKRGRAESVTIWGTGAPQREFLHVDDLASAALFLMEAYHSPEPINVGSGMEVTIAELAESIKAVSAYEGEIVYDRAKPDGAPRKLLDSSRLYALGWRPRISLQEGLRETYAWFETHHAHARA
ncbi:MAG: GDP-L-fucose synthase [Bryobacterales bacterium]|nr:GDP-L-fucose synthase [Bryobacterales bacterium]